ncbi:MAG: MFS transporter [Terracidiphilus sp.]|jgi:GPH family glycoside/pentoside/hexuronide:cation symporter
MEPKTSKLTFGEKTGYAFGDAASNLFWMTFIYFQVNFYTDVFFYTPDAALERSLLEKLAALLLLTRFLDMGFDLFMGVLGDRTRTRWGKFRPYLLWFAVPFGIISVLTFTTPSFSPNGKLIYAYITLSLMMMVYSAINIPYSALMGVISPDSQERTSVSSYRFAFAFAAGLVVQYSTLYLVDYFGKVKPEMGGVLLAAAKAHGYQLTMGIYAVAAVALFFLTFALTKERVQPFEEKSSLWRDLFDLACNWPWLILFGMGTLTVCAVAIRAGAILYYFKYYVGEQSVYFLHFHVGSYLFQHTVGGKELPGLFMVAGTLMSLLGTIVIQHVTKFAGRKATYIGLATLGALFLVVSYWVRPEQVVLMFVFQVLYSAVTGPTSAVLWAMFADSADYSEWRTGRRATGLVFSAAGMSNKLGWSIGGPVIVWLLAIFGYQANVAQTPHALHGILLLFTVIPAVLFLLTGVGLFFYPLNEARMKKLQGELQERQAKADALALP